MGGEIFTFLFSRDHNKIHENSINKWIINTTKSLQRCRQLCSRLQRFELNANISMLLTITMLRCRCLASFRPNVYRLHPLAFQQLLINSRPEINIMCSWGWRCLVINYSFGQLMFWPMKYRINKVIIYPPGTLNACSRFHSNPSNICQNISLKTENVNLMVALQTRFSDDHQSQQD